MRVQVPLLMGLAIGGPLVKTHRVGERNLEEPVVPRGGALQNVRQGVALNLEFPDNSFDWVTTFHVMSVVPDPLRMMQEMLRVCKPGGKIVLINHFASENPLLYSLVWIANPLTRHLGWTTRLLVRDVLDGHKISVERNERIARFSFHRVVIATKLAA